MTPYKSYAFDGISTAELEECARLRHTYFVLQKKWVSPESTRAGLEMDRYDPECLHLAVFQHGVAVAYLRVLPHQPEVGFMLDREFASLLSEDEHGSLPREGAVELSRLVCLGHDLNRWKRNELHPVELLFRLLYQESKTRGFQRFYIVVEEAWPRLFKRHFGLNFRVLGQPTTFPDGTRTIAAVATRDELEAGMKQHSLAKFEWYQRAGE